jgi:hypothetical protein
VDESFLREGMTIGIEIPGLAVRKLYYDITIFSRTDKRYINSLDDKVNELLAQAKDVENRIIDRRLATNDIIEFRENRSWLIKCYDLWLRTCRVKKLNPKVKIYTEMQNEYTNYFIDKEYDFKQDEEIIIGQLEKKESMAQETQQKLQNMQAMEDKMKDFDPENFNIPRLMMRLKKSVYPGLNNLYDDLIEKGKYCDHMLKCDTDEKYMETYISYVTACLQMHIIEKVGGRKQPGNQSRAFKNIKRTIEKGAVKKAIDEGKASVDVQKIESDILKVQADVEIARKFLRDYDQLQQLMKMKKGLPIDQEDYLYLADGTPIEIESINRQIVCLIGNLHGAAGIIKGTNLMIEEFNNMINNFYKSDNGETEFIDNILNEETMDNINIAIEKYEKEPFLRWNYNLKTKLRYNFSEDAKRT